LSVESRLAVIVISWNTCELLRGCLASLRASGERLRVIVVDNASSDGSAEMVRDAFSEVELIEPGANLGFVKANNLALRKLLDAADAPEFMWLLNSDTRVHAGAIATLLAFMQAHPRCGMLGPKLENPDGSLQHGAFALPGLTQLAIDVIPRLQARFRDTRWDGRYPHTTYAGQPFEIGHPLGAAMLTRIDAVRAVGVLDEGFEMYSEEIDWAKRMRDAGWQIWCEPRAVVTHFGGASSSQAPERTERLKWRSRQRYFAKHYPPLKRALARWLVPAKFRSEDGGRRTADGR
jgi:N-acetylglucosaminyl-diphospho-decaprenol L-rhamnosyltransferase